MKKTQFLNSNFYIMILVVLIGLIIWNVYAIMVTSKLTGLLPIAIQLLLIGLILSKNQYAEIGLKVWASLFLIIGSGLQFIGHFLKDFSKGLTGFNADDYIESGLTVLVGLAIFFYTHRTVKVVNKRHEPLD